MSQTYFESVYVSEIRRSNVPGFTVLRYVQVYLFYLSGKTSWVPDRPYQWYGKHIAQADKRPCCSYAEGLRLPVALFP